MIPLFGDPMASGKRFALEERLISVALQRLRLGTSVVLDYGLSGRDERSALRWLAHSAGASCQVVYLARGQGRPARPDRAPPGNDTAPDIPDERGRRGRVAEQFQVPDAAELDGGEIPSPPAGGRAGGVGTDHWPSSTDS